jgi:hypothetical protein
MEELAVLDRLLYLDISNTTVTDAGIMKLAPIDNLKTLKVSRTKISDGGMRALQRLLPDLEFKK